MSIRAFHIIFVSLVTLFGLALAAWAYLMYRSEPNATYATVGWSCVALAVIAPIYGVYFYKKTIKPKFIDQN